MRKRCTSQASIVGAVYSAALFLAPLPAHGGRAKDGDVLKIFSNQRVYVITNAENDAPALAERLLDGVPVKERRVLTVAEWDALPRETRWFVTCVYLVDRERLPATAAIPQTCRAEPTEIWQEVVRTGRDWGVAYDVTISAPDAAHLDRAIGDFRRLKEAPRRALTQSVRSLALVPVGTGAANIAPGYARVSALRPAHTVPAPQYTERQTRLTCMDEIVLLDRSTANTSLLPSAFAPVGERLFNANGDTIAWRETKPGGYVRAYVSAPNAAALAQILAKSPDNLLAVAAYETPTVLATARDLRTVRRVAVAGTGGRMDAETQARVATYAASRLRELNAFEVLERAALTTVLAEIALDQAGLTKGANRAKLRTLAAADALLIVDLGASAGGTTYTAAATRTTPPMPAAPRRPNEPSRLKTELGTFGGRNGQVVQAVAEGLLKNVVGTKTDAEYETALRDYQRSTLPAWERQLADYQTRADTRTVTWRETITAKSSVRVAGSVRLVDLADGMVLWEAPLAAADAVEKTVQARTAYSTGENSAAPTATDLPAQDDLLPGDLLTRTAESAVSSAIASLPGGALLPSLSPPPPLPRKDDRRLRGEGAFGGEATLTTDSPSPFRGGGGERVSGKVIDTDTDSLLVGLGATDNVKIGDTLTVTPANGAVLKLTVTRVRPRTCDARFAPETTAANRARVAVGDTVYGVK